MTKKSLLPYKKLVELINDERDCMKNIYYTIWSNSEKGKTIVEIYFSARSHLKEERIAEATWTDHIRAWLNGNLYWACSHVNFIDLRHGFWIACNEAKVANFCSSEIEKYYIQEQEENVLRG